MINGVASMAGSLAAKAGEVVRGAISSAKGALGIGSPSKVFHGLGVDTIQGYILGIDTEAPKMAKKTAEATQKALDAARTVVEAQQERFRASFDKLGEYAARAFEGRTQAILDSITARFDAAIGRWQTYADKLTPAEKKLEEIQRAEAERQRAAELAAAQAALAAAESEQQKIDALERIRQANLANQTARLQAEAQAQRAAQEKRAAEEVAELEKKKKRQLQNAEERRRNEAEKLDEQIENLKERLAKHPEEHDKIQKRIIQLLKGHGVSFKNAGKDLGEAFAEGLRDSAGAVERAAEHLAKTVAKYLPRSPAEKGPLARTDYFEGFGSMLAANMTAGTGALSGAAAQLASAAVPGMGGQAQGVIASSAAPLQVRVYIGERELTDLVRVEVHEANTGLARTLLAGAV